MNRVAETGAQQPVIKILIVDDHPVVRRGLAQMINQEAGLHVVGEAEDAHQAMVMMKERLPDLLIADLTLKDIGGLELLQQVQALYPAVQSLVLSMHDKSVYAERALRGSARHPMGYAGDLTRLIRPGHPRG
jgi:DNA-binding NarL/FixJ family response regulator